MYATLTFLSVPFQEQKNFSAQKWFTTQGSVLASGAVRRPVTDVRYQQRAYVELLLLETLWFAFLPSFTFTFLTKIAFNFTLHLFWGLQGSISNSMSSLSLPIICFHYFTFCFHSFVKLLVVPYQLKIFIFISILLLSHFHFQQLAFICKRLLPIHSSFVLTDGQHQSYGAAAMCENKWFAISETFHYQ